MNARKEIQYGSTDTAVEFCPHLFCHRIKMTASMNRPYHKEILHIALPSILSNITVPLLALTDLAIVGVPEPETGIVFSPLFHFEILALLARNHPLNGEPFLRPEHFATDTLITYPVPDDMLDIMRQVLLPAGISPERRTSELTVAILQLVASGRGIAALPLWAVKSYLDRQYVVSRPITEKGLTGKLYAATRSDMNGKAYIHITLAQLNKLPIVH